MRGIKSADGTQQLTGRDVITGPNGSGKTTRTQALGVALLGYQPGGGRLPSETMKLARGDHMVIGIETEDFTVLREFASKGAKVEQKIMLFPPEDDARTAAGMERAIEQKLGKHPAMFDFNEFLGLSDMKRREFIYGLADPGGGAGGGNGNGGAGNGNGNGNGAGQRRDGKYVADILKRRLALPPESDPEAIQTLRIDIDDCAGNAPAGAAGQGDGFAQVLQAMSDYAKEQASLWRREREKASGASQKIAEYKNKLEQTDRDLDENKRKLEGLYKKQSLAESGLAKAEAEQRRLAACNERISAILREMGEIDGAVCNTDPAELHALIAQYKADIKHADNGAEISRLAAEADAAGAAVPGCQAEVDRLLEEYQELRAKKAANESLLEKIGAQRGECPIDCRIKCDKDFAETVRSIKDENEWLDGSMAEVVSQGEKARAELEGAKKAEHDARCRIGSIQEGEIAVLRENEAIMAVVREFEAEIAKIENFESDKAMRAAEKKGELLAVSPEGGGLWELCDITPLKFGVQELAGEISSLNAQIGEQAKARNALANLKNSVMDSVIAGYHAENWKRIAEAVGPKGLQGELVKDALSPMAGAIQEKLRHMGVDREFYFQTEDDKGKEVFQFGWRGPDGGQRNFDALSTGEQLLLMAALMAAIIEKLDPPLKMLCIDNAENLDRENVLRVINGLTAAGAGLDNIIISGVMDVAPEDVPGWHVWELGAAAPAPADGPATAAGAGNGGAAAAWAGKGGAA